ncbi:MAG TPA: hypothetical protein VGA80_15345, partial [Flavobacteriaceae bacterium]
MSITIKNHYNPCFWTAYWNYEYYHSKEYREANLPRNQKIYSLNVRADKVLPETTKKVFYEERMGLAEINKEAILDFEDFFTTYEDLTKKTLFNVIQQNEIKSLKEKTEISSFIADLILKHYENFNSLVDKFINDGKKKIDFLIDLKQNYSSVDYHNKTIMPLVASEWILYISTEFKFPLGDNPVLINNKNILIALSPKMLLKINHNRFVTPETKCEI